MTTHELAALLLNTPNVPVYFHEYNGGDTPLAEVESAKAYEQHSDTAAPAVVLYTYN